MTAPHESGGKRLQLAVLISGRGRSLANLMQAAETGRLAADVRLVLSSSRQAGGLHIARQAGIQVVVLPPRSQVDDAAYQEAVFAPCRSAGVDLVVMAGFLKHVLIPQDFSGRVINIHPSLIPQFCGAGFYGDRVHEAVLAAGATSTGCTVHFVDDQYDHGPIILQRQVPVQEGDTVKSLAARVFQAECLALPEAIHRIARMPIQVRGSAEAGGAGARPPT